MQTQSIYQDTNPRLALQRRPTEFMPLTRTTEIPTARAKFVISHRLKCGLPNTRIPPTNKHRRLHRCAHNIAQHCTSGRFDSPRGRFSTEPVVQQPRRRRLTNSGLVLLRARKIETLERQTTFAGGGQECADVDKCGRLIWPRAGVAFFFFSYSDEVSCVEKAASLTSYGHAVMCDGWVMRLMVEIVSIDAERWSKIPGRGM